jgi:hypothetical protein
MSVLASGYQVRWSNTSKFPFGRTFHHVSPINVDPSNLLISSPFHSKSWRCTPCAPYGVYHNGLKPDPPPNNLNEGFSQNQGAGAHPHLCSPRVSGGAMCLWRASRRFATWGPVPRYLRAMSLSSQVPEMGTRTVENPRRIGSSSQDKKRDEESQTPQISK